MNFLLWRTAANQLFVLCWSSGWSPKPLVSVLDRTGSKVASVDELEVARQPDGLFSVRVRVNVEAVNGNFHKALGAFPLSAQRFGATASLFHHQDWETRA